VRNQTTGQKQRNKTCWNIQPRKDGDINIERQLCWFGEVYA